MFGLADEKKMELIFSPSPLVTVVGTGRVNPAIYTVSGNDRKPSKSNIRIMYYNGLKSSPAYTVGRDAITNTTIDMTPVASNLTAYPQVGNYRLEAGVTNMKPKEDLYYGLPKEMYFTFTSDHQNCPAAYALHFRGQITDITNPDVTYVDCQVNLNEIDIANLSLRLPVFVDMGELGHAYFKVLSIEYLNNNTTSRVYLQKIAI
jgi:hypothetical protein